MKILKRGILFLFIICLISSLLAGCAINSGLSNTEFDGLKVHYIDVGQGDSILIQVNNKNILIDAGTGESTPKLISYLKNQNIKGFDYVIATHPHEDHIGGMADVIKDFNVSKFYMPKKVADTKVFLNMVKALKSKNIKANVAKSGVNLSIGPDASLKMLAPNGSNYESLNNYSAVLMLTYKSKKFLFMGDAEKLSENEILDSGSDVACDVLKVGHHGSNSSTSKEFLDKVTPKIAIISCGKNNDYGHPHKATLTNLKKHNVKIYRTDIDGTIIIKSDGNEIYKE